MINSESPQQNDAYSCGMYTIMNTIKIAGNIVNKKLINKIEMETGDITKTRKWMNDIIQPKKITEKIIKISHKFHKYSFTHRHVKNAGFTPMELVNLQEDL